MNIFDQDINHLPSTISVPTQKVLWKIVARNNGSFDVNTGIKLQLTWSTPIVYHRTSDVTDTAGQVFGNGTASGTSLNKATHLWTVGGLKLGQEKTLIVETSLPSGANLNTVLPLTLTKAITVTGISDIVTENNTSIDTLLPVCLDIECTPYAAAVDGQGCRCSVATNDTPCNFGVTEWRLIPGSFVNTLEANLNFDVNTGKYTAYKINPTKPATFQYGIYCLRDGLPASGPFIATETITASFDANSINHTIHHVEATDLTPADIALLQLQNPDISVATNYCWQVIKNSEGEITSGLPIDCDPTIDNRTFLICTNSPCAQTLCPECPTLSLPGDVYAKILLDTPGYIPEKGDSVFVQHPNATSMYTHNGTGWVRSSCGCTYKISQNVGNILKLGTDDSPMLYASDLPSANPYPTAVTVTGTATKTVTITMSSGPALVGTFTDIDTGTAGQSIVQVQDTCSVDLSIVGDGSVGNPYVISAETKNGDPLTTYIPGIISGGGTGFTFDVTSLFSEMCSAGCTATYTLGAYPTQVFANVSLVGTTLTYDVIGAAPGGSHFIDVIRECN